MDYSLYAYLLIGRCIKSTDGWPDQGREEGIAFLCNHVLVLTMINQQC